MVTIPLSKPFNFVPVEKARDMHHVLNAKKTQKQMKQKYETLTVVHIEVEPACSLLISSEQKKEVKTENVSVESYGQGFGTDSANDFMSINFD